MHPFTLLALGGMLLQQPGSATQPASTPKSPVRATSRNSASASKSSGAKNSAAPASKVPVTDDEKTIYALGLSIGRSLKPFSLSPEELKLVQSAIADSLAGKPAVDLDTWGPKIGPLAQSREKAASQAFLDKAAAEPGVIKTASGLIYKELTPGSGNSPKATDSVTVNYRGTLTDGSEFDSSYKRNQPATFALNSVIPCWTEGLQLMKPGGKARLVCPSSIAYGDRGNQAIPGGAALTFEVELLSVQTTGQ